MREEPVFPSDLKMLTGLSELLSMVSPVLLIVGGLILLLLLITSIIVQRRLQKTIVFLEDSLETSIYQYRCIIRDVFGCLFR